MEALSALSVLKLVNPKHSILIKLNGVSHVVALLKYAYTPKDPTINTKGGPIDFSVHVRGLSDKVITGERWNWCQNLGVDRSTRFWEGKDMPRHAALVHEVKEGKYSFIAGVVVEWAENLRTISYHEFQQLTTVAVLTGHVAEGHHLTTMDQVDVTFMAEDEMDIVVTEEVAPVPGVPYTGDPIKMEDGHYIGDDGFRVPNDFQEFYEWQPHYLRNWVKKRLHKQSVDDDVLDWEQELTQHMMYLPATSKHRLPGSHGRANGCTDVVMTFNPYMQYGASERRFRNYINYCLANKFMTLEAKEKKNPISRLGNFSLASQMDTENFDVVDDEYVHKNSEHLNKAASRQQKQHDDKLLCHEYLTFVNEHDPSMLPVITAISESGTLGEASRQLGMSDQEFSRARNRLKQLAACFQEQMPVPKQRKQYKTRAKIDQPLSDRVTG